MKRFVAVLSGLLVLPAFAEVAPIYYDEAVEYSDTETTLDDAPESVATPVVVPVAQPSVVNSRAGNRNASRAMPTTAAKVTARPAGNRAVASSRATTNAVTARTAQSAATRGTVSRVSTRVARSATGGANQIATTRRAMQSNQPAVTARASIVQTDTVNTPLYTGRVGSRASAVRARIPAISAVSSTTSVVEDAAVVAQSVDELAQITDFCKAQYTSCMDNFCNVLDDAQGRCSCSKNLTNYASTEAALKQANEELQEVAQQIQYIGLSSDQIETLFTQTQAEMEMASTQDNTALKVELDNIKDSIVAVKPGTASTSTQTNGLSLGSSGLFGISFDSLGYDLTAMFGNNSDTTSISNQRGEQLYKTAAMRCKASVLDNCSSQGVDISVITNSYDLEIDKQCIIYERELTEANDNMMRTVRNAKGVLQNARLLVAQQKNAYNRLQCIQELDKCMRDDFVCGSNYEYCLDPSGKYIVNGSVVVGSQPGESGGSLDTAPTAGLYQMWNYETTGPNNTNATTSAWGKDGNLAGFVTATMADSINDITTSTANISEFLQGKIGYYDKANNKNYGSCMYVLNQCQDYTYTGTTNDRRDYLVNNTVVSDYLQRTLVNIKASQDEILAEYAEKCVRDVSACLSKNNYDPDTNSGTNMSTKNKIATKACSAQITTCMSVNGITAEEVKTDVGRNAWILSMMSDDESFEPMLACTSTGGTFNYKADGTATCTCGNNSTLNNGQCDCNTGYTWDAKSSTCKSAASSS